MNPILPSRQPTSMVDYMRNNPYTRSAQLATSPIFKQADVESQRRMSQNVARGLPSDIDPQRIFVSGYTGGGTIPQYSAVLGPMGFGGGWGSIGMDRERNQRGGGAQTELPPTSSGGPQPNTGMENMPNNFSQPLSMGLGGLSEQPATSPLAQSTVPKFPEQYEDVEMFTPYGSISTRRPKK